MQQFRFECKFSNCTNLLATYAFCKSEWLYLASSDAGNLSKRIVFAVRNNVESRLDELQHFVDAIAVKVILIVKKEKCSACIG